MEAPRHCSRRGCRRPMHAKGMCRSHYMDEWRARNADHIKAYSAAQWRSASAEKRQEGRERAAEYYRENRERVVVKRADRYAANRDAVLEAQREARRRASPEQRERRERTRRAWAQANAADIREWVRRWRAENRDALGERYILNLLGLSKRACPPVLLEAKRAQLMLHRMSNPKE